MNYFGKNDVVKCRNSEEVVANQEMLRTVEHGQRSIRDALAGKGSAREIEIWSRGTIGNSGIHTEKKLVSFARKMMQTMFGNDAGRLEMTARRRHWLIWRIYWICSR